MKKVTATQARSRFGQAVDHASTDLVVLARRGKETLALMPEGQARLCTLSAHTTGVLSRSVTMSRLGYTWYGQLADAIAAAGLRIQLPESVLQQMDRSFDVVFGKRGKRPG